MAKSSEIFFDAQGHAAATFEGEAYLIELQGTLTVDQSAERSGQLLGRLKAPGLKDSGSGQRERPELIIGHHRLTGQIVKIDKPLLLLEKKVDTWTDESEDVERTSEEPLQPAKSPDTRRSVIPIASSSPGPRSELDPAYQTYALADFSSSPGVDRKTGGENGHGKFGRRNKKVKVSYLVKGIFRQKIVFNTRPAPIVSNLSS